MPRLEQDDLADVIGLCGQRPELLAGIAELYRDVDALIRPLGVRCMGGGCCCKFDLFDHRLYATGGEIALLIAEPAPRPGRVRDGRCPYQQGPRCLAHARRPLSCRTFFCLGQQREKLEHIHEDFHQQLATVHQRLCIPYRYVNVILTLRNLLK